MTKELEQCFPTGVPPWVPSKCSAKVFGPYFHYSISVKLGGFCLFLDVLWKFLDISVPPNLCLVFGVPRAKKGWEPLY